MFKSFGFAFFNNIVRPALEGAREDWHIIPWVLSAIGLSVFRKYLVDGVNGRETDPTSFEFWKEVVDYSGLGAHIVQEAVSGHDAITRRGSFSSRTSSVLSFIDDFADIVGAVVMPDRKIPWRKVRNATSIVNTPAGRLLTNPLLP
jgi:hypothetical protein